MPTYRIDVTLEDIKNGIPSRCTQCPVSLALMRQVPYLAEAVVGTNDGELAFEQHHGRTETSDVKWPKRVSKFIADFDNCIRPVKPFAFTLRFKTGG